MKKIISVILMVSLILSVFVVGGFSASAATYNGYVFTTKNEKVTIVKYVGDKKGNLTIPSKLNGYPVTSIGDNAFEYCDEITKITIPSGVTTIGDYAFHSCYGLKSVSIPNTVTTIGNNAFVWSSLESVKIPNSVTSLGEYAFAFGQELTSVSIGCGLKNIPDYAFAYCHMLEDVIISEGVNTIGEYAFYDCYAITSIVIPDSVTQIKSNAFYRASLIKNLSLGNNLTTIGDQAFYLCDELQTVKIPASVTNISVNAFDYCYNLLSFNVDEANQFYASSDGVLFNKDKTKLIKYPEGKDTSQYVIPLGVTEIGDRAFFNAPFRSIVIWQDLKTIAKNAFLRCAFITDIYVQNSEYFSSVDGVLFNKDKTVLLSYPQNKENEEYVIPDTVVEIVDYAFVDSFYLENLTIGKNVSKIGNYVFDNCNELSEFYLDENNTAFCLVEGVLFNKKKTRLIRYPAHKNEYRYFIPHTVTKIDPVSFPTDDYLKEITIPKSVTEIGDYAFEYTERLFWINYDAGEKQKSKIKIHEKNYYLINGAWHYYSNSCDDKCNLCGMYRDISHPYDDENDKICNVCNYVRTVKDEKLVKVSGKWYHYVGGEKSNLTTLVKYNGKWFYVKKGVWDQKAKTLVKYNGQYFYIKNGKWEKDATTLVKYSGKYFYVKNGKWDKKATTLVKYSGKWRYVKNGKWCKDKAIVKYSGKKFYVNKGYAKLSYSGKVKVNGKTYKIKKGKVV